MATMGVLTPGSVLGGRYYLQAVIGDGGMARVFRAHDVRLQRNVAIKVLHAQQSHATDALRRFAREARFVAALTHPHIVAIYDVGHDDDTYYIVMEDVPGGSLRDLIRRSAPLPLTRVSELMRQLGSALDAAHAEGVIHRDIKPENILLTPSGQVKVSDFGIARALTDPRQTATGMMVGSVSYVSPEQAQGQPTTAASDLYSSGVVLYELLTGRPPYVAESPLATALQHLTVSPTPPSLLMPALRSTVDAVVLRALSKEPERRFPSGAALADALAAGAMSSSVHAAPTVSMALAVPGRSHDKTAGSVMARRPATSLRQMLPTRVGPRSRRAPVLPLLLLLALLGTGAAYATLQMAPHTRLYGAPPSRTPTMMARRSRRKALVPATPVGKRHEAQRGTPVGVGRSPSLRHIRPDGKQQHYPTAPPRPPATATRIPLPTARPHVLPTSVVSLVVAQGVTASLMPLGTGRHFDTRVAWVYVIARGYKARPGQLVAFHWIAPSGETGAYAGCARSWMACYTAIPLRTIGTYRVTLTVANVTVAREDFTLAPWTVATGSRNPSTVPAATTPVPNAGNPTTISVTSGTGHAGDHGQADENHGKKGHGHGYAKKGFDHGHKGHSD